MPTAYVIAQQVWMIWLNAVIKNRNNDTFPGVAKCPGAFDVHVITTVCAFFLKKKKRKRRLTIKNKFQKKFCYIILLIKFI